MTFPQSQNFDALTTGSTVDATTVGADITNGTASSTVVVPGLKGSAKAWRIQNSGSTNSRSVQSAISAQYTTVRFTFKMATPPNAVLGFVRISASGTQQALLYETPGGSLRLRSTGTTLVVDNTDVYTGGTEYDVHYEYDRTNKLQTAWITNDADGYYKKLGPAATGGTNGTEVIVGYVSTITTADVTFDNYQVDDTQITPPAPPAEGDPDLVSAIVGNPTQTGFTVQMETTGCQEVRLIIDPNGTPITGDTYEVTVWDSSTTSTKVTWDGAAPQTTYEWQAQGRVTAGVWTDIGPIGKATSFPAPGVPAPDTRIAITVCEFPPFSTRAAWDLILDSTAPYWFNLGDWVYANDLTTDMEARRRYLLDVINEKPGLKDCCHEKTLIGYTPSDHDRTNNSVTSDPCIGACIQAQTEVMPNPTFAVFDNEETTCASYLLGRDLFILADARTEDREEGKSRGGGNGADMWGAEQRAWIYSQIRRVDCDFRFLVLEMPIVGESDDVTGKHDHGANYPDEMTNLGDVMSEMNTLLGREAGMVIGGDYHCMGIWYPGTHANIPWGGIVGGGTANMTGNGRDPQNYSSTYGFNDADLGLPDDTPISVYWKLFITDDGDARTVQIRGWDAFEDELAYPGLEYTWEWSSSFVPGAPRDLSASVRQAWKAILQGANMFQNVYRRDDSHEQVQVNVYVPYGTSWDDADVAVDVVPLGGGTTETLTTTIIGSTSGPVVILQTHAVTLAAGIWEVVVDLDRGVAHPRINAGQIVVEET